ncbi:hypothetical protein PIB30_100709 [Stylosanthes scabra]|uniref:CCHC-type domain-containing protein n=1 Tax=Stylosanthes scabra TaxID=79078 RepID=A0ABU6ZVV0_9FABA|nr:hypothetical protein [Stylosanthes scabra]
MTILKSQGGENKKKSLALKASSSHDEESDDEEEDQDFKLLIKKFTKFTKRENLIPKKQNKPSKCFECGEIGHIKTNCPKLQKREKYKKLKKKQKAYMSWENEDDSSTDSDNDKVANICLMANDEKIMVIYDQGDQGMHEEQATHKKEQPSMMDLMKELQLVNHNIGRLDRNLHRVEQHLDIQDDEEDQD